MCVIDGMPHMPHDEVTIKKALRVILSPFSHAFIWQVLNTDRTTFTCLHYHSTVS